MYASNEDRNPMYPSIIGLVGHIRAGKTSTSDYLATTYKYKKASNSDVLREISSKLGLGQGREDLKLLGDSIFSTLGNETIARYRVAHRASWPIVVDGIRYEEEIEVYRSCPSFRLLGIRSPDEVRYSRAQALVHEGKDDAQTFADFQKLSSARSEAKVGDLLKHSDHIIDNSGDISSLHHQIDLCLAGWLSAQD
jgi:dephospho-CoA kinase